MVKTTALLWLLVPCGWLALWLNGSGGKEGRMQEQEFVKVAMSSLQFEIEAGGYAYARAADSSLIEGGAQLAADYGAACTELAGLAASEGLAVPDGWLDGEQQMLERLTAPEGESFDKKYAEQMARWYDDAIELFERATSPGVQDPELRHWAAEKLSMLRNDSIYQAFRRASELRGSLRLASSLP